jgi:hypothetical protein
MPYILNKTNGNVLATVNDAAVDLTTNLTFVGRNYSGYGEIVNENFLKLLENFSNTTANAPSKPVQGQIWFNSTTKQLNVSYDGKAFKGVASMRIQTTTPATNASTQGDLWWDPDNTQLKAFDGSAYQLIGPPTSSSSKASWVSVDEPKDETTFKTILKASIGSTPVATISNYGDTSFPPLAESDLYSTFINIKKGITLPGADANGSTVASGYYFWGTAAESLTTVSAGLATTATLAINVTVATSSTNVDHFVTFVSSTGAQALKTDSDLRYNPSTNVLTTTATAARYADLAERYAADMAYEVGTVVVIGGAKEVTGCEERASTAVAGIVSKNPAYMMNSEAGSDETHPYIALKGRVPCKIIGTIKKGNLLVTSARFGHACAKLPTDSANAVIGKALEDHNSEGSGIIEVLVV